MRFLIGLCVFASIGLVATAGAVDPPTVNDGYGDYVLVAAGSFRMGDNFNEGNSRERPVHTVEVDAFYIGKYEVTNAAFRQFREGPDYNNASYWPDRRVIPDPSNLWTTGRGGGTPGNDNYAAAGITWDQAVAYCNWLSAKTGKKYRLPTEAEWEKAARGNDQRRYPWGNEIDPSVTTYAQKPPMPVGFFNGTQRAEFKTRSNASPYGAFDMEGSLFEWCSDWYSRNYYGFSPKKNPPGPETGAYRVLRGAANYVEAWELRAANRSSAGPSMPAHRLLGFRCVRER